MSRQPTLTDDLIEEVAKLIEEGHDPFVVASSIGVHKVTFYRWLREGREDESGQTRQARLVTAVARAQAEAEIKLGRVTLAGDEKGASFGPAKAALEVLSRRIPARWAQRVNVKVERELEDLLEVVERICSPEDFERVLEAIAARDSSEEAGFDSGEARG